jgi:DNA-binding NtrC family response regulator
MFSDPVDSERPVSLAQPSRILVVDDEPTVANVIARMAESFGHEVAIADSVVSAIERLSAAPFDVVLTDVRLGVQDGFDLLRHVQQEAPEVPVVLITGMATIDAAMEAIRAGAYDYLAKPPQREAIGALLRRAIEKKRMTDEMRKLQKAVISTASSEMIAGHSPRMLEVFKTVARVAPGRTSVLILGESGSGKELVARALHQQSLRAQRRFVPANVSAIPEGLLESELFGHVRGAFTGATTSRRGLFEEAHLGTLFLDEIGDLSLPLQAKLLRVIQEHRVKPVGGNEEIEVDVRLVAATHRDLEKMVRDGTFREDLYFRINVVSIAIPALRDRTEDIPDLVEHFIRKHERETGVASPRLAAGVIDLLKAYAWPGNVRELENVMERAILFSQQGAITPESLPARIIRSQPGPPPARDTGGFVALDEMVERYVREVLEFTRGNRTSAAQLLGISRRTLHRMEARRRAGRPPQSDNLSNPPV